MQERSADESSKDDSKDNDSEGLEACASDILKAVKSGNVKALASALKAHYDICEASEPSEDDESSEPSPHSYDAQNQKAGQE